MQVKCYWFGSDTNRELFSQISEDMGATVNSVNHIKNEVVVMNPDYRVQELALELGAIEKPL